MLGTPSRPSFSMGVASLILIIADLLLFRVDIWRGGVRVVASMPSPPTKHPPARLCCEPDGHVDMVLSPDIVVSGVPSLHCLCRMENSRRHDPSSTFTTLMFREKELDGFPH